MSKYVVLSFDDGRSDTYENAVPIMDRYGITATINITTDFISHPEKYGMFKSACNKSMSESQVLELYRKGYEIASHGNGHINDPEDVRESIKILHSWGIDKVYGFASPVSELDEKNVLPFINLIKDGTLSYIISGLQVQRQGFIYTWFYVLQQVFKSKYLFYRLNKKELKSTSGGNTFFFGISVSRYTTADQMVYLLSKMLENAVAIFIFHSILDDGSMGIGVDKWYWTSKQFEEFLKRITCFTEYKFINSIDIVKQNI